MYKGLFWFGCCVACFVLNGWLCGVSVLLIFVLAVIVLWVSCCGFGLVVHVLNLFFLIVLLIWLVLFFCSGLEDLVWGGLFSSFCFFECLLSFGFCFWPPHLTLNCSRFFVCFGFLLLFCLFGVSSLVLFLWVELCLLFWFCLWTKTPVCPTILVFLLVLWLFKTCFTILFLDLLFCCALWLLVSWSWNVFYVFLCCLVVKRNTVDSLHI